MTPPGIKRYVLATAIVAWSACVAMGVQTLHAYAIKPGTKSGAPMTWPQASAIPPGGITVVMFVHPECPCTRASLAELATVLANAKPPERVSVAIIAHEPAGSALRTALARLPDAKLYIDVDGNEAARFGAHTSGHVVAYDARGRLAFEGGITAARGHVGDNIGARSLARVLAGQAPQTHDRDVFGCGLEARR